MSNKKNYNKISTEANTSNIVVETEPVAVETTEPVVAEPVAPVVQTKVGVVANCEKLNVRKKPNVGADVVTIITRGTEVEIDKSKSTKEFYKVRSTSTTEGFDGYCMKKFISIK